MTTDTATEDRLSVARTILGQLGGNRFAAMTGARNFVGAADSLTFAIPGNLTKNRINRVRVTLEPSDTYTVTFWAIRGTNVREVTRREDVYCDELEAVFTEETGLYTSL